MAEGFDPYHKWLGIPPAEQPPHHYRLLGIAIFESDPDVIEHAADRQMAHVRSLATGKYAQYTQKLLNELAAAKVCLLCATEKAAYDQELRARLGATQATGGRAVSIAGSEHPAVLVEAAHLPVSPGQTPPLASVVPAADQGATSQPSVPVADVQPAGVPVFAPRVSPTARLRRSQRASWLLWSCGVGLLLLGGVVAALVIRSNPDVAANLPGGDKQPPHSVSSNQQGNASTNRPVTPEHTSLPPGGESVEQQVIRLVAQLKGRVVRAPRGGPVVRVDLAGRSAAGGEVLKLIGQLSELRDLALNGTGVTDSDLMHLSTLAKLEKLHLGATAVSAEGHIGLPADLVLVGADAITSEGNVINKIGTSTIALLAHEARKPFYVVAELLKFDPATVCGEYEQIEERSPDEVWKNAPEKLLIRNPAFDITRRDFIHGVICEEGVIPPHAVAEVTRRRYPWIFKQHSARFSNACC